jgi:hypothetical protein
MSSCQQHWRLMCRCCYIVSSPPPPAVLLFYCVIAPPLTVPLLLCCCRSPLAVVVVAAVPPPLVLLYVGEVRRKAFLFGRASELQMLCVATLLSAAAAAFGRCADAPTLSRCCYAGCRLLLVAACCCCCCCSWSLATAAVAVVLLVFWAIEMARWRVRWE